MLDTLVLTFDQMDFNVEKPEMFNPPYSILRPKKKSVSDKLAFTRFINNPTSNELKRGIYRPRITVEARPKDGHLQNLLKAEFSAPKLLYRNNLEELTEADLPRLIDALAVSLRAAGVFIPKGKLRKARVSWVHYSKNFIFTDGTIPMMCLEEIRRCNVSERLDDCQTDYQNTVHALKYRCNSYEIAFYDKVQDLKQAKVSYKRTVEGEDNLCQAGLYERIEAYRRATSPYEVLRFEVRLNRRPKIGQILKKVGEEVGEMNLEQLFSERISKKVLLYYLKELEQGYPAPSLFGMSESEEKRALTAMPICNPKAKHATILASIGYTALLKCNSPREVSRMMGRGRARGFHKLLREFKRLKVAYSKQGIFPVLKGQLNNSKPFKDVEFIPQKDNNVSKVVNC